VTVWADTDVSAKCLSYYTVILEAEYSAEFLVSVYDPAWRHNPRFCQLNREILILFKDNLQFSRKLRA
jgi:hypothetical protein